MTEIQSSSRFPGFPYAVIDVGSNSVRLVVFDGPARAPVTKFNEKVLCGLGRRLVETGELDSAGVALAEQTIKRHVALARAAGSASIDIVATAAIREAANGASFAAGLEKATGVKVRILSGEEEARYSAIGVLGGMPDADGLIGDIGGGSLELVSVAGGNIGDGVSLPLGPFRVGNLGSYQSTRDYIDNALDQVKWLPKFKGRKLYPVGGAWRAIARVHMAQTNYPLRVIQGYKLGYDELSAMTRLLSRQSKDSLSRLLGVPRKRQETLPLAALVLRRLIKKMQPSEIVFSAHGLREGLCFDRMSDADRREDPLMVVTGALAERESRFGRIGNELDEFLAPAFPKDSSELKRLRRAACFLSDIGWRQHPDYRGDLSIARIMYGPLHAVDHRERAMLGLAIYARYQGHIDSQSTGAARQMLGDADEDWALRCGVALRFAHNFCGGAPGLLADARLKLTERYLALELPPKQELLVGESMQRRFEAFAKALGREADIRVVRTK